MTKHKVEDLKAALERNSSVRAAARELGINESTIRKRLKSLDPALKNAMDSVGTQLVPSVAWIKTKGFSVLLRPPVADPVDLAAHLATVFADLTPAPYIPGPALVDEDLVTLYPLADVHLGMLSWGEETGEDYDTSIAVARLRRGMTACVASAPNAGTAIVLNAGDFLHANDDTNSTPASKHALDTDSRHWRTLDAAVQVTIDLIDMALTKHAHVIYRAMRGNHDPSAPPVLTFALAQRYRNNSRVTIEKNPSDFFVHEFGQVMITAHHGDKAKPERLVMFFADEHAPVWGRTKHRFLWTGHLHHHKSQDIAGMKWEQLRAVAARDAYASSHAYSARSEMVCVTYHRDRGEVQRGSVGL